jgi:2',3'-cyclic-nucleotide 2'-phosphodiesterase (5'-nucleotidase family)
VLPFDNVLVDVKLTGEQILEVLKVGDRPPAVGGIRKSGSDWILKGSGQPLDMDATYSVLVNDFMYAGGDNYTLLAKYDPNAYNTTIDWRQPVIDWITAQNSSPDNPLDEAIAGLGE